ATSVVSQVAASPVTASVAERVVGVIAAVTVTGAIGVGAVTVAHHHHAAARKPAAVVVTTAPPAGVAPAIRPGKGKAVVVPTVPAVPASTSEDKGNVLPATLGGLTTVAPTQ